MKRLITTALLSLALLAPAAQAGTPAADDAIFVEGTRYSAVLSPSANAWRLLPADGAERRVSVASNCRTGLAPPRGLWLLTQDAAGQPQLVAPSSTPLPAGHPGLIRLVDCDQPSPAGQPALALPAELVQWLQQHSGAIYVAH